MATHALPHVFRIRPPFRQILEVAADYCRLPVADGFSWGEAFAEGEDGEWYLVAFRSKHATDADEARLTWLDEQASAAASRHPGFLYYFIGTPLPDGGCLSFCLWESPADARAAADDPAHRLAMEEGLPAFAYYRLERFRLRKEGGVLAFHDLPSSFGARDGCPSRGG